MLEIFQSPELMASLLALTVMEIVLGIDNVVFIAVLVSRLPVSQRRAAQRYGLLLAFVLRVLMLLAITTLMALTQPLVTIFGTPLSWRDLILIGGGVLLIFKAAHEIHTAAEGGAHLVETPPASSKLLSAILQIAVINLVFSIDSTMTAIGMARHLPTMIIAIVVSMFVMYVAAGWVTNFINRHPAAKMLALAFLLIIGIALLAEGVHSPIDRGVLYTAMGFAVIASAIAMAAARRRRRAARQRAARADALRTRADQTGAASTADSDEAIS